MKKKRVIALGLSLALVISALSACSSSKGPNVDASTQEEVSKLAQSFSDWKPEEYTLPLTDEPVTLSFSLCESWTPQFSLADNREIFQAIEKDTGVKIDWQVIPGKDYDTVMKTKIASGEIPDIMGTTGSMNPIQLYEDGLTIDHGEYISKYAPNILKIMKEDDGVRYRMMGADGKVYSATVNVQYKTANVKGIYYRKDWQKALGISDPQTLDDYYNMFKAFAEKDPNGNGEKDEIAYYCKGIQDFGPFATAFGLDFQVNAGANQGFSMVTGDLTYQYARPEYKDFLAYIKSFYDANIIPKEVYGAADNEKTILSNNRLGAYYNGLGQCDTYDNILLKAGYIDKIDKDHGYYWLCPPENDKGEHISPPMGYVQDNAFVVSKDCKYPEIAIKWLDYVWGTEAGARYTCYGIEGKSYTMENGKPVFTDFIVKNPDGLGVHPALRTMGSFTPWITRWSDEAFAAQWAKNDKMTSVINEAKPTFKSNPLPNPLGTPDEIAEIASIQVDLGTYVNEMTIKFIMGQESLDNFDDYIKTLYDDYRLQELIDIRKAQLAAYK